MIYLMSFPHPMHANQKIKILVKVCQTLFLLSTSVVHVYTWVSLTAGGRLKNWLLRVLGRLLSRKYRMVGQALNCQDAYF